MLSSACTLKQNQKRAHTHTHGKLEVRVGLNSAKTSSDDQDLESIRHRTFDL